MKISIFVTEDAMQFNLEPETPHETKMLDTLQEFTGDVHLGAGHDIGMCQGGYIRNFGAKSNAVTITINKPVVKKPD